MGELTVFGLGARPAIFLQTMVSGYWTTYGPESMLVYRMIVRARPVIRAGERGYVFGTFPPCAALLPLHR